MSRVRWGLLSVVGSSLIWGFGALWFAALAHRGVGPLEVLAHRVVWTLACFGLLLALRGRLGDLRAALSGRSLWPTVWASIFVSVNWGLYVLAVESGQALEASLAYYILPLLMAVLGGVVLGEWPSRVQSIAFLMALGAVTQLTWGLGTAPWIALAMSASFAVYSLFKKRVTADPIVSVTAEVLVMTPLAIGYLAGLHAGLWGAGGGLGKDLPLTLLLVGLGVFTGLPLILFSKATQLAPLPLVGLVSYLNPTLQFIVAATLLGGVVTVWHGVALGIIWTGLALTSAEALRGARR